MSLTAPAPPFLLPQNRRLRHLRGIYLRNLTFVPPTQSRPHGADDAQVATKLHVDAEAPALAHARSSDDLSLRRETGEHTPVPAPNESARPEGRLQGYVPPARRRVTLSGATALARQHILEQALVSCMADAFFSLHCEGVDEPIYVSEVEDQATNFNFRFFDLGGLDPFISRASQLTVKVWVARTTASGSGSGSGAVKSTWTLLIEDSIDLRFLGCISSPQAMATDVTAAAAGAHHFAPNSILFHLPDGVYMAGMRNSSSSSSPPAAPRTNKAGPALPTSSYSALMRLANLTNSLQDCLATQDKLAAQIDDLLRRQDAEGTLPGFVAIPEAEEHCRRVAAGLAHQQRLADAARRKHDRLAASLAARRAAIAAGRAQQQKAWADVAHATQKLAAARETDAQAVRDIRGQRGRICRDLDRIFAIGPAPASDEPLAFQIAGIPLANTVYGPLPRALALPLPLPGAAASSPPSAANAIKVSSEESLAAALGLVATLVNALQGYLGVPLPYDVSAYGSRSFVRDAISKIPEPQRTFPLYVPRGGLSAQYRFDYGWFLLNKNIETLCHAQGLKVVDIRHTLPNLKYLLYVCSSGGAEDLPERKRGGVRGLWLGRVQQQQQQQQQQAGKPANGDGEEGDRVRVPSRGAREPLGAAKEASALSASPTPTLHLPFDEDLAGTWTLRTKGMREIVDG